MLKSVFKMQFNTDNIIEIICRLTYFICNQLSIATWAFIGSCLLSCSMLTTYSKYMVKTEIIKPYLQTQKCSSNKRNINEVNFGKPGKMSHHFIAAQNTSCIGADTFPMLEEIHYTASRSNISQLAKRCLNLLQCYPKAINHVMPPKKFTPFLRACSSGGAALVKYMLLNGADISCKTSAGDTAMILATYSVKFNPHDIRLLEILVQYGCNVNTPNDNGCTPLHIAAKLGNLKLIWWLMDNGAIPNTKMKHGFTPADIAQTFKHNNVAKFLSKPFLK